MMLGRALVIFPLVVLAALILDGTALAQEKPEYKLGFKALADQIPDVVGEAIENEHWGANGDSLQQTTKGLMAWRKADNWTAFTNGSRTWVNGPNGVQERGNDKRFSWEAQSPVAAAPASSPAEPVFLPRYEPVVKAMDDQSGPHGVMVSDFVKELYTEWTSNWGWKPTKPTTFYLFFDGNRLVDYWGTLKNRPPTDAERKQLTAAQYAWTTDTATREWAVLINLSVGYGASDWQQMVKGCAVAGYTSIMQQDVGAGKTPRWFRDGFTGMITARKIPGISSVNYRYRLVTRYRDAGKLPTLRELQQSYDALAAAGGESYGLAWGIASLAVGFLADQVGGQALLEMEKKLAVGTPFETALQDATGYTIDKLDLDYRVKIPR